MLSICTKFIEGEIETLSIYRDLIGGEMNILSICY